jgi:hypothetical protein
LDVQIIETVQRSRCKIGRADNAGSAIPARLCAVADTRDSPEDLLRQLEETTGRVFRSREDVRRFAEESLRDRQAQLDRISSRWRMVKNVALLASLVLAFLQYYLLDTLYQIVSLRETTVFVPVRALQTKL